MKELDEFMKDSHRDMMINTIDQIIKFMRTVPEDKQEEVINSFGLMGRLELIYFIRLLVQNPQMKYTIKIK